jgi:DnaA N-terminal domain
LLARSLEVFMVATTFQNGHKPHRVATLPHQQKAQSHRQKVKDLLPNRTVGYSPDLARAVGGATIGLFLSQLLFLSDKGANPEGWVYKSEAEMGRETGLTKREQQTARRKLLALGVIQIVRQGFKFTYHFRIVWERLYQVIEKFQRGQTVATEKVEPVQNVPTQSEQNVSTDGVECLQNVSTKWKQNVATQDRDNNTENKETEKTDRENQTIWQKVLEQLQADLPQEEAETRLNGTTLIEVTDAAARIGVNNPFAIAWLERRMYGQISKAIKGILGKDLDLQFVVTS